MNPLLALMALLVVGVHCQDRLEEIFDMNMGLNLAKSPAANEDNLNSSRSEGRVQLGDAGKIVSSNGNGIPEKAETDSAEETVQECGYRQRNGVGLAATSADDQIAQFGEFPWVVAIFQANASKPRSSEDSSVSPSGDVYKCAGSLIHPLVILTSAHNIDSGKSSDYTVRAGEWALLAESKEIPHQDRKVSYRIIHPQFTRQTLWFDVALLFLERPFDLTPSVNTICLVPPEQQVNTSACFVSGWGIDARTGKESRILKRIELPIVPNPQCEINIRNALGPIFFEKFTLHESFICAGGEPDKDACHGDGGAPLMCPIKNAVDRYYLAGIVSWGLGCARSNEPGVYANVCFLKSWIDDQLKHRRIQPSFYTPTILP